MPTTTASSRSPVTTDSASTPASLRSATTRSLGHFKPGRTPASESQASTAPNASAVVTRWARDTSILGLVSTENSRLDSGAALQLRPRLPRPALWYSAANTAFASAP